MPMSSVLDEWETFRHRYRLCRSSSQVEGWTLLKPTDARWAIQARFAARGARMGLLGVYGGSDGSLPPNIGEPGVLERELEQRRLFVHEQRIATIPLGAPAPFPRPDPTERETEPDRRRAWIDVMVIDDSVPARALDQAGFRLRLPDYSTREGVLDGQGRVYLDDLEPGRCWLELTDPGRGIDPLTSI